MTRLFFAAISLATFGMIASPAAAGNPSLSEVAWVYAHAELRNGERAFGDITVQGTELPKHGIRVSAPAADVPASCAAFSGIWTGTHSNGRPLLLIVEKVNADCMATVSVGWGSEPGKEVDISPPWEQVRSKRWGRDVLKRSGRNVPVTYSMDDQPIKDGLLEVQMTSKHEGKFKVNGDSMTLDWGSPGTLRSTPASALQLQPQVEPPAG